MCEIIVVTSGKGGVGKTTTTANIGAALALSGKKVAMIVLGLEVAHAHIHLIPMNEEKDVDFKREKLKLTPEEFAEIAASIAL